MKLPQFFISRPRFAIVLSAVVLLVGMIAYFQLPVSQYPEVAPPTIVVTASYPGATPATIARTVATPLEQEINGVENMLYMESQSTADGAMQLTVTFALGTDIDEAQVLVQNRVAIAEPRLPAEARQIGVTTKKSSPDLMMVVHLISPDDSRDQLYISNYAFLRVRDILARQDGIGDVQIFGGSPYSMRIWLDVDRIASLELTAGEVIAALREQNVQVAAGAIGQEPITTAAGFEIRVNAQGRLRTAEEFAEIIVKGGDDGRLVRLADVARIELGAQDYATRSYLNGQNAVAMVIFQRPGSNALETANGVIATMDELKKNFPAGIDYRIVYNPTEFVADSIDEVFRTLLIAALLVVLTVFIFLQSWRTTIIPVVAIPISLVGTFAIMLGLDVSLNSLSLFGLVLAIGIVVDDAIVVVEAVERLISKGLSPLEASRRAMEEVASALVATTVVLVAVFVPTAFVPGLSGRFYQQFALTIAAATSISTFVSLTLSPAMAAIILKPKAEPVGWRRWFAAITTGWFFAIFNRVFEFASRIYGHLVSGLLRARYFVLLGFLGLLALTWWAFQQVPTGFIPPQDQGYLIVAVQLPDGSSLERTDRVVKRVEELALGTDGIRGAVAFTGFSGATFTRSTNTAAIFTPLEDAASRAERGRSADAILADLRQTLGAIDEAFIFVLAPPPVPGIGTGGGFKMQIQDREGVGFDALNAAAFSMVGGANQTPGIAQAFSTFSVGTPQIYADIDRSKARMLDVPIPNILETLQTYLGSVYVNDFNALGRIYRVTAQAEGNFRDEEEDILQLRTRSNRGAIVPLGSLVRLEPRSGPSRVVRYNLFPAADIQGEPLPGVSTGEALDKMEALAAKTLPPSFDYEWTNLSYQERNTGGSAIYVFILAVVLAFLALTAQYESWGLPLAVILIVPTCLLSALAGVWLRGMDNNILVQVGFIVLVGLACKNAILIVEYAKAKEDEEGLSPRKAAIEACRIRLRPILMTSFSFVLGVIPLVFATGAGAEMRQALGTAVFAGMLGVTFFGLLLTPVFYMLIRSWSGVKDS